MRKILLLVTAALIALQLAARPAFALDAPHNTNDVSWSITCTRCHYSPTSTPPWATLPTTTDNTFKNNLCKDCHSASGMPLADPLYTNVKTHSAEATSSSYWNGNWTVECVVCHSPHYQQQSTNAAYSAEAGVNVVLGTTTSLSTFVGALTSTLFDTAASLPSNSYVGYLLIPNTAYPTRAYRVRGNTATSITVD
jgi:cytochrome c553